MINVKVWQNEIYKAPYGGKKMQQVAIRIEKDANWRSQSIEIPLKVSLEYYNTIISDGITKSINRLLEDIK